MKKAPFYQRWYKHLSLPFEIGHFRWTANWAWGEAVDQQDLEKIRELQRFDIRPSLAEHNHNFLSNLIGRALVRHDAEIFDAVMALQIPVQCFNVQLTNHTDGNSLLHYAGAYPQKYHCLIKMLDYGVSSTGYIFDVHPLLLSIVKSSNSRYVHQNEKNGTAFLAWKMVAVLGERGMSLNAEGDQDSLFSQAQSASRIRWLMKKGCDLTEKIQHKLMLQWVQDGRLDLVAWLYRYRGDLNPLNEDGQTPFQVFMNIPQYGQKDCLMKAVEYFVAHDQNLLHQDKQGNTFFHTLTELVNVRRLFYTPEILARIPMDILNQAILMPNKQGKTPLMQMTRAQRKLEETAPWVEQWILRFRLKQAPSTPSPSKHRL